MDWQDQLREIVTEAKRVPSFEEWLINTGYEDIPQTLMSPVQMRSIIQTLYTRYQKLYRKAA